MEKLTQFVEEKIAPPLIKFSNLKYVQIIGNELLLVLRHY